MGPHLRRSAAVAASLAILLSVAATARGAESSSEREKQTSGVTPDKTSSSAGNAKSEGTGEGRQTPAEKAPTNNSGGR